MPLYDFDDLDDRNEVVAVVVDGRVVDERYAKPKRVYRNGLNGLSQRELDIDEEDELHPDVDLVVEDVRNRAFQFSDSKGAGKRAFRSGDQRSGGVSRHRS